MQVTRSVNFTVGVSSGARVICTRVKIFSGIRVYFIFFVRLLIKVSFLYFEKKNMQIFS